MATKKTLPQKPAGRRSAPAKKSAAIDLAAAAKQAGRRQDVAAPARKAATRKTAAPARTAATGPVTLAEAKALAGVPGDSPAAMPAARGGARAAVAGPAASPGLVAAERRRLVLQQRREMRQRIRDYKATLAVMKRHGVRGPDEPPATARAVPRAVVQPLQVFAEGDSWFDYPVPLFGGGIVPRLERRLGVPILNLGKAGDEVRYMLGVEERKVLAEQLRSGCPAGGPWDVLLFSGGGNDIVDNPMALWVRDFDPALPPAQHVHRERFQAALALVRAGYEDLIALRDQLSAGTRLVFHAYDFALPDGRGVCRMGPWLKPTFDLRGFPPGPAAAEVVKAMLQAFAAMLRALEADHADVTFIDGQGTLAPQASSWHNELHPSKDGFGQFARLFHEKLKSLYPDRVLG